MPTAEAVARYFLHLAASMEEPSPVTHMQLHKLLYYAQGWTLATRNRALFPARFQAWVHGPVETTSYPKFADYESSAIAKHEAVQDPSLTGEERGIIRWVWACYGMYSAWRLRDMTHGEPPWKDARASVPNDAASRASITDPAMRTYFRGLHEANCKKIGLDPKSLDAGLRDAREGRTIPWEELKAELLAEGTGKPRRTRGLPSRRPRRVKQVG